MKLSRVVRLLELIGLLQAGKGQNAKSLASACGVSRRTIFRDLDILRQAGLPLLFDEARQHYQLSGTFLLPPTNFTPQEAMALLVLCQELGRSSGVPFLGAARSAGLKLESALPHSLRDYLRGVSNFVQINLGPTSLLTEHEGTYEQLLKAVSEHRSVRITYDSLTEWSEIKTRLNPYRLLFSRRSWYVIGRSSLHRGTRTFNVGRIRALEMLDDRFRVPRGFSIERQLRNAWHLIAEPGPDHDVVIRFDKMVAQNVSEVAWHKTQRIERRPDGSIDFHATVSGLGEISWWVLGYGDQARVIRPKALRDMVVNHSRHLLDRYRELETSEAAGVGSSRVDLQACKLEYSIVSPK